MFTYILLFSVCNVLQRVYSSLSSDSALNKLSSLIFYTDVSFLYHILKDIFVKPIRLSTVTILVILLKSQFFVKVFYFTSFYFVETIFYKVQTSCKYQRNASTLNSSKLRHFVNFFKKLYLTIGAGDKVTFEEDFWVLKLREPRIQAISRLQSIGSILIIVSWQNYGSALLYSLT